MAQGWIGVDLDGTLAQYDGWQGPEHIGPPVPAMLARVKRWLAEGHEVYGAVEVRIMTARVCTTDPSELHEVTYAISKWCKEHVGVVLHATNKKDYGMIELWDDRAVQVEPNTGRRLDGQPEPVGPA